MFDENCQGFRMDERPWIMIKSQCEAFWFCFSHDGHDVGIVLSQLGFPGFHRRPRARSHPLRRQHAAGEKCLQREKIRWGGFNWMVDGFKDLTRGKLLLQKWALDTP